MVLLLWPLQREELKKLLFVSDLSKSPITPPSINKINHSWHSKLHCQLLRWHVMTAINTVNPTWAQKYHVCCKCVVGLEFLTVNPLISPYCFTVVWSDLYPQPCNLANVFVRLEIIWNVCLDHVSVLMEDWSGTAQNRFWSHFTTSFDKIPNHGRTD